MVIEAGETALTRKFIFCQGIPASGKSTWAKEWVGQNEYSRVRINRDDIRNMLGVYWLKDPVARAHRENYITQIERAAIKNALMVGYDIVSDNMNLNPEFYHQTMDFVNDVCTKYSIPYKYEFEFKMFDVPVEECIRRDKTRQNPIGESAIREVWKKYRNQIIQNGIKRLIDRQKEQNDPNKIDAIILDMDATLCFNDSGRPFYGNGAEQGVDKDLPNQYIVELAQLYKKQGFEIIILTGREGTREMRDGTEKWLKDHNVEYDFLIMRPIGSFLKGDEQKKQLYKKHIEPEYNVHLVIDDSQKCVDMWRELGLVCLQPNEGKY